MFPSSGPKQVWQADVGTGYGSPVTSRSRVFLMHRIDDTEIISCFDAKTGSLVWEHRYPTTFHCEFEYSDGPAGSPLIDGDYVYAVGGQHQVFCLNIADGTVCWSRDLGSEYSMDDLDFAVGSCPLIVDGKLIYNLGCELKEAGVIAIDQFTGETIWTATDHAAGYCSPISAVIHGEPFVFAMTSEGLVSIDPSTGQVDWHHEHHPHSDLSYNSTSPTVVGDLVLAVSGPGPGAVCLKVNADRSYQVIWKDRRILDSQFNSLIVQDHYVFGFTAKRQGGSKLRSIDIRSGDMIWESESSQLGRGQGLRLGASLLLTGEDGHVAIAEIKNGAATRMMVTETPIAQAPLYTSPAVFDRYLYIKDEAKLVCFEYAQ
ncbi:PQQ-like beta-propeller repeat protein [Stieleria sp. JC731]|uniref:PQQ-binding-like beta-propeller repeat protein n=1 Tax=Pirellulaceae TaxID=2691357 RepID=UPI001E65BBD8|nr:PQQ-binding-like beta-propeller repeat protein [Stieleria sp. JC731]MCC9599047.1 PQQ-like beta-propeller repeat protein [Stieleria sp. JC731]